MGPQPASDDELERRLEAVYVPLFEAEGAPAGEARSTFRDMLVKAKDASRQSGFAGVDADGYYALAEHDPQIGADLQWKIAEGVREADLRKWWDIPELERQFVLLVDEIQIIGVYTLFRRKGLGADEAARRVKRANPTYVVSRHSSEGPLTEDSRLPVELKDRVNRWTERLMAADPSGALWRQRTQDISSLNALIRQEIKNATLDSQTTLPMETANALRATERPGDAMSKELQASVQRAIERLKAVLSPCLPKDWMSAELPSFSRDPKPVMVSLCCRSEDVVTFAVPFLEIGLEPSFKEFASVCGLVRRVRRKQAGELYQLLRWFARFAARHRTQIIEAARRGDDLGDASVIDPYTGDLEFGPETLLFEFAEAAGATPAQARQYALHGPTPPPKSSGCLLLFVTGLLWIVACVTG